MMRRAMKRFLGLAVVTYMGIASILPAHAASTAEESVEIMDLTKDELGEWLDIEAAAQQYGRGVEYSSYTVEDIGDDSFTRTLYWTDVYGGARTDENIAMAYNYGVKKVNFVWD